MNSVFIHIARTGGTTVSTILGLKRYITLRRIKQFKEQEGNIYIGHQKYKELVSEGLISGEFDRTAFKYAFSRDPYSRAVSQFLHCKRKREISEDITFVEFCRNLAAFYRVCYPQHKYLEGVRLDFLGKFENLIEDLQHVADVLGIELPSIPKLNSTRHEDYRKYHSEETVREINRFYDGDFDLGYRKCHGMPLK